MSGKIKELKNNIKSVEEKMKARFNSIDEKLDKKFEEILGIIVNNQKKLPKIVMCFMCLMGAVHTFP